MPDKLTTEAFVAEARRRALLIRERRGRRTGLVFSVCAACACLALIVALSFCFPLVAPDDATPSGGQAGTATMLSESAVGGYVLIGVICFVLGAIFTLLCLKVRRGRDIGQTVSGEKEKEGDDVHQV